MSLYCLVYTSIAIQKMSDDDLKDLLKKIRQKNETRHVTGMLLYLDPFSRRYWKARKQRLISCLTLSNKIQDTTKYRSFIKNQQRSVIFQIGQWDLVKSPMKTCRLWKVFLTFCKNQRLNFSVIRLVKLMNCYISSNMKFCFEFPQIIQNRYLRRKQIIV